MMTDTYKRIKKWADTYLMVGTFSETELAAKIIDDNYDNGVIECNYLKEGNLITLMSVKDVVNNCNYLSDFGYSGFVFISSTKQFKEIMNHYGYKVSVKKTMISKTPSEIRGGKRTLSEEYGDITIKFNKK